MADSLVSQVEERRGRCNIGAEGSKEFKIYNLSVAVEGRQLRGHVNDIY